VIGDGYGRTPRGVRCLLPLGALGLVGCPAIVTSVGSWAPDASTGTYLEAEDGELSAGFVVNTDPTASGGRYLEARSGTTSDDAPGMSRATYELAVPAAGTYVIWGRIRSPSTATNRFWVQVDGGPWLKWRITVGDIWFWDRLHDDMNYDTPLAFPLSAGMHQLAIANCVDGVELDRLYYTTGKEMPPGNTTPCSPPNSIELGGACVPSCGSQGGNNCGQAVCSGHTILPSYDCGVCCITP
jgi:hypothetical protein